MKKKPDVGLRACRTLYDCCDYAVIGKIDAQIHFTESCASTAYVHCIFLNVNLIRKHNGKVNSLRRRFIAPRASLPNLRSLVTTRACRFRSHTSSCVNTHSSELSQTALIDVVGWGWSYVGRPGSGRSGACNSLGDAHRRATTP